MTLGSISCSARLQSDAAVEALRELGCERIWIGSESGSQRILGAMKRGVTVEHYAEPCAEQAGTERGGRIVGDESATQNRHAIRDAFDLVEIVRGQEDRAALTSQAENQLANLPRSLGIET